VDEYPNRRSLVLDRPGVSCTVVIPAYNESARIAGSLEKILAHATRRAWSVEILVVNDGSTDNTADIVRSYAERNPQLRLVENPGNRGKGYSVRNGMLQGQGDILLFSDADLSSPIEEADKLFEVLAEGADVAIGSRQPLHRQLFGRVFNLLLRMVLGLRFKDTQCGFKAFTRRSAEAIFPLQQIERWGFDPELLYIATRFGLKTVEVPVEWAHRTGTRINPLRDGSRMFMEMLRIRWYALTGRYHAAVASSPIVAEGMKPSEGLKR
jgi:dolichyl-phosphate beta-glucosyltransferase